MQRWGNKVHPGIALVLGVKRFGAKLRIKKPVYPPKTKVQKRTGFKGFSIQEADGIPPRRFDESKNRCRTGGYPPPLPFFVFYSLARALPLPY